MNSYWTGKQTAANICSHLENYISAANGMGMSEALDPISTLCRTYRSGDKRVVFIGTSNSGKSTLINALLGNCLLSTSMKTETSMVTHIHYGEPDGSVKLYKKELSLGALEMPIEQFFREYRASDVTAEVLQKLESAAVQTPVQKKGFVFVDTPDFQLQPENSEAVALEADRADAVVVVLNANRLLELAEREWVWAHLCNGNRQKVFIAVNWSEYISDEDFAGLDIHLRNGLAPLFLKNGHFSPELFEQRVFYVDALLAENARTGNMATVRKNGKFVMVPVPPQDLAFSGIPELEKALEDYLAQPREETGYYVRCIERMQQLNQQARDFLQDQKQYFRQKEADLECRKQQLIGEQEKAAEILTRIRKLFDLAGQELTTSTMTCYDRFLHDVAADWEAYANREHLDFGLLAQAKIAGLQLKQGFRDLEKKWTDQTEWTEEDRSYQEQLNEIVKPIIDAAMNYLTQNLKTMVATANSEADRVIQKYIALLEQQCEDLEKINNTYFLKVDALEGIISQLGNDSIMPETHGSATNIMLSLVLFQNTAMAYDMMFHDISVDKLIQEGVNRKASMLLVDFSIGILTGGGYWAAMLLREAYLIFCRVRRADQYGKEIFCSFKEPVLQILHGARDYIIESTQKIHEENLYDLHAGLSRVYLSRIEEAEKLLERNLQELYSGAANAQIHVDHETQCADRMEELTNLCAACV